MAASVMTLEVTLAGNVLPVLRAFALLTTALAEHGHRFGADDQALLDEAVRTLNERVMEDRRG